MKMAPPAVVAFDHLQMAIEDSYPPPAQPARRDEPAREHVFELLPKNGRTPFQRLQDACRKMRSSD